MSNSRESTLPRANVAISIQENKSFAQPFHDKKFVDGTKLFRRKHGVSETIDGDSTGTIEFEIPYGYAKITCAEIINCKAGDTADFEVYDNAAGTISGVPNLKLNQFGFNVQLPNDFYRDTSKYDADLIQGMKIKIIYKNNDSQSRKIGVNFVLHEVV